MQPHYSQSSRENATASSDTSPLASYKEEPPPPGTRDTIICCDCQATYIVETGRNLGMRLTEHKRATRNDDVNNHIIDETSNPLGLCDMYYVFYRLLSTTFFRKLVYSLRTNATES